jgi:sugar lactone lactonase YvrE
MEELIRNRLHNALDVQPPPANLRHSVIWGVPMDRPRTRRMPAPSFQWVGGFVAALLAVAIVAALMYTNGLRLTQVKPGPAPTVPRLQSPEGIAVGPDGSVYVSDYFGQFVLRVEPDGRVVRIAGGGTGTTGRASVSHLDHPAGIAVSRDGYIYIADSYGGVFQSGHTWPGGIVRIDPAGQISTFASGAPLQDPLGLALDSIGILYFTDYNGNVGSMDLNGAISWVDFPHLPGPVASPYYMTFDSAGSLLFSDRAPNSAGAAGGCRIVQMTPQRAFSIVAGTGTCGFSGDGGPATKAELNDPSGVAFDSRGNLFFADAKNHRIRRIDRHGIISTVVGTGTAGFAGDGGQALKAQLTLPFGIAIGPGDRLYIADSACDCENPSPGGRVRVVDLTTGVINTLISEQTAIRSG